MLHGFLHLVIPRVTIRYLNPWPHNDTFFQLSTSYVMVVGSNLARGKIFTASIGSVDSLYFSLFIYCMNLQHKHMDAFFTIFYYCQPVSYLQGNNAIMASKYVLLLSNVTTKICVHMCTQRTLYL